MKKYLFFLLIISRHSFAQVINLTCMDPKDNFTIHFQMNEKEGYVISSGKAVSAHFDAVSISFDLTMSNGSKWLHIISRTNGNLMIQNSETKERLPTWKCSVENKKF